MYMYIHVLKNVRLEGDIDLDPPVLLDGIPENVFFSPSNLLHIEPPSLLHETFSINHKSPGKY